MIGAEFPELDEEKQEQLVLILEGKAIGAMSGQLTRAWNYSPERSRN